MVFAFLGTPEIIIILIIALVVFGPQKLPEIGRQVGSALRELNKMRNDVQRAFEFDTDHHRYDSSPYGNYGNTYPTSYNPPPAALETSHETSQEATATEDYPHGHEAPDEYSSYYTDNHAENHASTAEAPATAGNTTAAESVVKTEGKAFVPPPGPAAAQETSATVIPSHDDPVS